MELSRVWNARSDPAHGLDEECMDYVPQARPGCGADSTILRHTFISDLGEAGVPEADDEGCGRLDVGQDAGAVFARPSTRRNSDAVNKLPRRKPVDSRLYPCYGLHGYPTKSPTIVHFKHAKTSGCPRWITICRFKW